MKTKKISYNLLYRYCAGRCTEKFILNSSTECLYSRFAREFTNALLGKKFTKVKYRCRFAWRDDLETKKIILSEPVLINGKETQYDFPQKIIDFLYKIANGEGNMTFTGAELTKTITKLAKKKF